MKQGSKEGASLISFRMAIEGVGEALAPSSSSAGKHFVPFVLSVLIDESFYTLEPPTRLDQPFRNMLAEWLG